MNRKQYQLLPFVIDSRGRFGQIASDFYYGPHNPLYRINSLENRYYQSHIKSNQRQQNTQYFWLDW